MRATNDINVEGIYRIVPPRVIREDLPMTPAANETVVRGRETIQAVLAGSDRRLIVVVGPCSIHDKDSALEYAQRLAGVSREIADRVLTVMRVYCEKPRTTVGWKGLISDPGLDNTADINAGLRLAREITLRVNEMGLPAGTEMLDPITPQYLADLISWGALGARTTESQTHRQMASGLSMPIGFKNGTDGSLDVAINAMEAARSPHSFLGIDNDGLTCVVKTRGNPWGHLILRGGRSGPNYHPEHIELAARLLAEARLLPGIMIDCSHANSGKDYRKQRRVWKDVLRQRAEGAANIVGLMLESNLREGAQKIADDPGQLERGVSVTDACIGWDETEELLRHAHATLA